MIKMTERIPRTVLEDVANTVADGGLDFKVCVDVLRAYAAMNLIAWVHANGLCVGDFPKPEAFMSSVKFTRRYEPERRVGANVFVRLRRALVSDSSGRDFALAEMDEILDAMSVVVKELHDEVDTLEAAWMLPAVEPNRERLDGE